MQLVPPCPASARWWGRQASGLLLLHWQLRLVFCVFFFFSWLCCALRLQNSPQTGLWEGFLLFGNFSSFTAPSPARVSIPNPFVSLLSFMFFPMSFWREWAAFLGAWCPLPAFRSCFVEVAHHSNHLFINLWERNWSPRPIHLPSWDHAPPTPPHTLLFLGGGFGHCLLYNVMNLYP